MDVIAYKKTELAKLEGKNYVTIWKQTDNYIPIKIYWRNGNLSKKWYQLRYLRVEDIEKFNKEQAKIKHKWSTAN